MSSFTSSAPRTSSAGRRSAPRQPLADGPRWFRSQIRRWGPFVAVLVQAVVGLISLAALRLFDSPGSGAIGLIGSVCAAPALLIVGAPFGDSSHYPTAVAVSALLWLVVGFVAARRATRSPVATWSDYWRHFAWLCAGVWVGATMALGLAALAVSESLV